MYLTAQRVVSRQDGQEGINSFYHRHRPFKQPRPRAPAHIAAVAENNTGKLVKDNCSVEPGGNRVKSYLDIVAPDDTSEKRIISALDAFEGNITQDDMGPIVFLDDGIGIRFNTDTELYKTLNAEYTTLRTNALSLLRAGRK